jgi:murein DD-endopeptidase MepM/ murein hydrolase activator NlpD
MKPSALLVLGTFAAPLSLAVCAGLPGHSEVGSRSELNSPSSNLIAADPGTNWIRVRSSITLQQLADQLDVSAELLSDSNGLPVAHRLRPNDWVALPVLSRQTLNQASALDISEIRLSAPARNPLAVAAKFASEAPLQVTSRLLAPAARARLPLAILPGGSGGLSWPDLPLLPQRDQPNLGRYGWPAAGTMTSGYGWRWGRMHRGIDIANSVGTPVVAAADGTVISSGWNDGGYGYLVEVSHRDGSITRYAHNSRLLVSKGQEVAQGQPLAQMGSTGRSTGPHLHFEIVVPGSGAINPMALLSARS